MRETTVAQTYAEALLEFASKEKAVDEYTLRFDQISDLIETENTFRRFLDAPGIQPAEKNAVLREVFGGVVPDSLLKFLFVVVEKRRQRLLPIIAEQFAALADEHFGRLKVQVTLVSEPDQELRKIVQQRLEQVFGKDVTPRYRIDSRIIGGVILREGDRVADGSVRRRLQLLRRKLLRTQVG